MNIISVTMVRVYVMEASHLLPQIESCLVDADIRGISVFRAISGFGESGSHTSSLLNLSLDLPLVVEFFDDNNKITGALKKLCQIVKPEHIVFWEAKTIV